MDQLEQSRVIDYNERYHYVPPNTKIVLASTPESVSYNVANGAGASETNLSFMVEAQGNFLDRAITLKVPQIPLKIARSTAVGGTTPTLEDFLGNHEVICMRQWGLLNAISSVKIVLDGKLTLISNDPAKNLKVISAFADRDILHRFFKHSASDIFAKYSEYSNNDTTITVVPIHQTTPVVMRKPVYATGSIFSELSDSYSSRIPLFSLDGAITAASTEATLFLHDQSCLIPMSIFGLPVDNTPLYNAKNIAVSITLYGDWPRRIFSTKSTLTTTLTDITFNRAKLSNFNPTLDYIVRTGPRDSPELANRPYAVELNVIEQSSNTVEIKVGSRGVGKLNMTKFDLVSIPKKSYIFVRALHSELNEAEPLAITKTPDFYGRIDSLKIRVGNKETTIASKDASVLYALALQHGLTRSYEQSCYLSGFCVPIDFSESVGVETGALVGTNGTRNGGSPSLWVALEFTNLTDVEMVYEVGVINVYQTMLMSHDNTWSHKSSFESWYDSDSGVQDLEQQLMTSYNYIGGRDGGGIGAIFSSFLPKIGNGLKNLVRAAFTDPQFRKTIADAWSGPRAPLQAAQNAGASFDNHAPFGGFYAHSNAYNQTGGQSIKQWSSQ